MLMITVDTDTAAITVRIRGPLAGPEARELARNWPLAAFHEPERRVVVDLAGVTSVDAQGRKFLAEVDGRGDTLVAGIATKHIVDEIKGVPLSS